MATDELSITPATRRDVLDWLSVERTSWSGRMDEPAFLSRLWNLERLPSTDFRYGGAHRDITQHRVYNRDWDDDWVFDDPRFELRHGSDEQFVAFLAEMLHPVVRRDPEEVGRMLEHFNACLARDGWRLVERGTIGEGTIYAGRQVGGLRVAAGALELDRYARVDDAGVIRDHLRRIDSGLEADPAAAIASSKELLESTCKMVLDDYEVAYGRGEDLPGLFRKATEALGLSADDVPDSRRGAQAAKKILRALVPQVQGLAELRNELGLGHGRTRRQTIPARHARLAFNSTVAVVEFLLDTWHDRRAAGG